MSNDRIRDRTAAKQTANFYQSGPPQANLLNIQETYHEEDQDITLEDDESITNLDTENIINRDNIIIKTSRKRWGVLLAMATFSSLAGVTDTLSPILDVILAVLDLDIKRYVYISQIISYIASACTILPSAWFVEKYGVRRAMYLATTFLVIKNISRALMFNPSLPNWQELKFTYFVISCFGGSAATIIYYIVPLKISESWFAESERSVAWVIIVSSSFIGASASAALAPRFIKSVDTVVPLFYVNIVCAILTTLAVVIGISRGAPRYPPSKRVAKASDCPSSVRRNMKRFFTYKNLLLQLINSMVAFSMTFSVNMIIQNILISTGHSKVFVGDLISINDMVGLAALLTASFFTHRLRNPTLACKLATLITTLLFISFIMTMIKPMPDWIVLVVGIAYNISNGWTSPAANNMVADLSTGLVSQPIACSLANCISAILLPTVSIGFVYLKRQDNGYTLPILVTVVVCLLNLAIYLLFFDGERQKFDDDEEGDEEKTT